MYQNKRVTEADFEKLSQVYYDKGEFGMLVESVRQEKRNLLKQGKLEVARSLLAEGLPIELIMKATQLSKEEIEKFSN